MKISNWPKNERPREKLLINGAKNLSDAELLAIFIRSGIKGKTAIDLARESLMHFGNLRNLLDAKQHELCKSPGFGKTKYVELQASLELSLRYLQIKLNRSNVIDNAKTAELYLTAKLRNSSHEIFACMFLDNHNQVICFEELFHGDINNAVVYPREIIKKILQHNASNVIFAHNHTSGIPTPSIADKKLTQQLKKILALVDVNVLDHIIIGEQNSISFAELELL